MIRHQARVITDGVLTYSEYQELHRWVRKELGVPSGCENCGRADKDTRYEWANMSGKYLKDLSDWARLCGRCHKLIDGVFYNADVCRRGHKFTPENTYVKVASYRGTTYKVRACRECRRQNANTPQHVEHRRHYRHLKANKTFNNCERCMI